MLFNKMIRKHAFSFRVLPDFIEERDAYAIGLTLVALPFIIGVAAFVIDASRIANLHTDLQNATDAMALAGARELDGRNDAVARAQAAIAAMSDNEAWFGDGGGASGDNLGTKVEISFNAGNLAGSDVVVSFLGAIPASDDTKIGNGACATSNTAPNNADCTAKGANATEISNNAKYVRVVARPKNVRTIFPLPGFSRDDVPVSAEAVATYTAAACDVTPIYICNPFEPAVAGGTANPAADGRSFNEHFADGNLYGRQITMRNTGSSSPAPGNFGFLRTNGNGASVLAEALATGSPGVCYSQDGLDTEPGANVGPVEQGLNTRMGIYRGSFGNKDDEFAYRPDINVRKGQRQGASQGGGGGNGNGNGGNQGGGGNSGASCSAYDPEVSFTQAMALPTGLTQSSLPGGAISDTGDWDIDTYWDIAHGGLTSAPNPDTYSAPTAPSSVMSYAPSYPESASGSPPMPSRYDVYRYEIDNNLVADASPNGETGSSAACYAGDDTDIAASDERRVIFSAILNCNALAASGELQGASTNLPAEAFARMFITKPAVTVGTDKEIYLEMIDVTGAGGRGTLDLFLREEAELVR